MTQMDIAIIGAGMAGASLAAAIGSAARVVLIEAEDQPGYHATGRSAAFWSETYGGPAVQPLTSASWAYLSAHGFLHPRGGLTIATAEDVPLLDAFEEAFQASSVRLDRCGRDRLEQQVPGILPAWIEGVAEPSTRDIDVAAMHAHYLRSARDAGARLLCGARVLSLKRAPSQWEIATTAGEVRAGIIVNAAGAWASPIAALAGASAIDITPYRRTMVQLAIEPAVPKDLPLVVDARGKFYFKPEADGRIWLSPHDETPAPASDAAPEEVDIALAIHRLQSVVNWRILRKERAWAGLRSFAPDRAPIYGFDPRAPGFFWFAGQGGFGIQTAPAAAMIGATLILGKACPAEVSAIDIARYFADRF